MKQYLLLMLINYETFEQQNYFFVALSFTEEGIIKCFTIIYND